MSHGVKCPDSKPPFSMTGEQVFAGVADEMDIDVVDVVTVVSVDDVMTSAELELIDVETDI